MHKLEAVLGKNAIEIQMDHPNQARRPDLEKK